MQGFSAYNVCLGMLKPGQHLYFDKGQSQKGSVDGISAQIQIDADKHL